MARRAASVCLIVGTLALIISGKAAAQSSPYAGLDPTFGHNGRVITSFANGIGSVVPKARYASSGAVAVDGKGRTIVAGRISSGNVVLVRYLPNGKPDPTFGESGYVVFPRTASAGGIELSGVVFGSEEQITVVCVLNPGGNQSRVVIARFQPNGTLDQNFGIGGVAEDVPGQATSTDEAPWNETVALDPTGRVFLASDGARHAPSISCFTALSGTYDQSFGFEGEVQHMYAIAHPLTPYALTTEGNSILAGGEIEVSEEHFRPFVAKITPEGTFDPSFGKEGILTLKQGAAVGTLAVTADHDLLAFLDTGNVVRIRPDGSVDTGFRLARLPRVRGASPPSMDAMNVDDEGRITLGGRIGFPPRHPSLEEPRYVSYLDRFLPSGAQDPHFRPALGSCGPRVSCGVNSLASAPGGKLMAAEWRESVSRHAQGAESFAVGRYR